MLTCQQLTELVTDYLEGRLGWRRWLSFQMHIGLCFKCRIYLKQMKVTIATLGKLPEDPLPADIEQELLVRFRNMKVDS